MNLVDEMKGAANRGTASVTRAAERLKLNSQMNDAERRRKDLASQLGAALYPLTEKDERFNAGNLQPLYAAIASCDAEKRGIRAKLEELDAQERAQQLEAQSFACAICGAKIRESDLFCSGCGIPAEKARPAAPAPVAAAGPTCPQCSAPVAEADQFCMTCGTRLDKGRSTSGIEGVVSHD